MYFLIPLLATILVGPILVYTRQHIYKPAELLERQPHPFQAKATLTEHLLVMWLVLWIFLVAILATATWLVALLLSAIFGTPLDYTLLGQLENIFNFSWPTITIHGLAGAASLIASHIYFTRHQPQGLT